MDTWILPFWGNPPSLVDFTFLGESTFPPDQSYTPNMCYKPLLRRQIPLRHRFRRSWSIHLPSRWSYTLIMKGAFYERCHMPNVDFTFLGGVHLPSRSVIHSKMCCKPLLNFHIPLLCIFYQSWGIHLPSRWLVDHTWISHFLQF